MMAAETAPLPPDDSDEKMAWGGQWAGGGAPLLSAEAAQRTRVVRLPGLMSIAEVDSVHELAAACFATAGRDLGKYDGSWETTYLHTAGLFRQRAPALLERLVDAAWAADLDTAAGGACQLAGRARDSVGLRVIEYHDVTAGGGLPDPQHRDLGSLLTLDVMLSQPGVDFEGGAFCTLEPGGVLSHEPSWLQQRGDAVLFVSHKVRCPLHAPPQPLCCRVGMKRFVSYATSVLAPRE
jgi:hypothetical protein